MKKKQLKEKAFDFWKKQSFYIPYTSELENLMCKFAMLVTEELQTKVNSLERELRHETHLRKYWHDEYCKEVDRRD